MALYDIEQIQSENKVLEAMVNKAANEKIVLDKENISLSLQNETLVERLNGLIRDMQSVEGESSSEV